MSSCTELAPQPLAPGNSDAPGGPTALWQRYHRNDDTDTENELVEQYLPLVRTVVGRLMLTLPAHVSQEDLYSAGLVGLLQAVRSFSPKGGASFETFARFRIRGAVLDELRRMDWVPRLVHDKARRIETVMATVEQRLGRPPTEEQMAQALHLTVDEYRSWLDEIRPATFVCLDAAGQPDGSDASSRYESIADPTQEDPAACASRRELQRLIAARLDQLPDMQRKVLSLYYVEGLRLREIAAVFGLTESRISQIHSQAILAIRTYIERQENQAALRTTGSNA